jgi:putative addiction module component (TIGR02574 family)
MPDFDTLLADASQLPLVGRLRLIDALLETVPEESQPPLSSEWLTEIERRSAEYDAGQVASVAWEDIRAAALNRLKQPGE